MLVIWWLILFSSVWIYIFVVIQGLVYFSYVPICRVVFSFSVVIFAATPRFSPRTPPNRSPLRSSASQNRLGRQFLASALLFIPASANSLFSACLPFQLNFCQPQMEKCSLCNCKQKRPSKEWPDKIGRLYLANIGGWDQVWLSCVLHRAFLPWGRDGPLSTDGKVPGGALPLPQPHTRALYHRFRRDR